MWAIILFALLLNLFAFTEYGIRIILSRMRNAFFGSIFYWTMYVITRFAFIIACCRYIACLDDNLTILCVASDQSRNFMIFSMYILATAAGGIMLCTTMNMADWFRNRRRLDTTDGLRMHHGPVRFGFRHHHLPIYDLISLLYTILVAEIVAADQSHHTRSFFDAIWPCKSKLFPVIMIDPYPNDPIFPECSVMHSILLFICDKCTKDNGFYLIRSSTLRQRSHVRYLGPFSGSKWDVDEIWMNAVYQRGLILINVANSENQKLYSYDIRNGQSSTVFTVEPRFNGIFCWIVLDDGNELGDRRNSSSTYFRMIYQAGQGIGYPFAYGQSLFEVSKDKRSKNHRIVQHIPYEWSWLLQSHQPFITSTGRVGMQAKLEDATSNGEVTWKTCVVYDPESFKLKSMPDIEDLMETDRPLRLYTKRYLEKIGTNDLPCASVLNDQEALVCHGDGTIWRTRFQPPSLKSICLEKIFKSYEKKVKKVSSNDWLQMTGVDMRAHFLSKNWSVLKRF